MQGISFQLGDYKVKGSDVGEQFKFKSLDRYFNSQSQQRQPRQSRQADVYQQQTAASSAVSSLAQGAADTLAMAAEVASGLGELASGMTGALGNLFQPGSGQLDENEQQANKELLTRKRKPKPKQKL